MEKDQVIGRLTATRENQCYFKEKETFNPGTFLGANRALVYALKHIGFGKKNFKGPYDDDFIKIWNYGKHIVDMINLIYLITANYGVLVEVPKNIDITRYMVETNITPALLGETLESIRKKSPRKLFKFTENWEPVLQNYKKFGLCTETEIKQIEAKQKIMQKKQEFLNRRKKREYRKEKKILLDNWKPSELERTLMLINSLELGDLSRKQLKFYELQKNIDYNIGLLKLLSRWSSDYYEDGAIIPVDGYDLAKFFLFFIDKSKISLFSETFISNTLDPDFHQGFMSYK